MCAIIAHKKQSKMNSSGLKWWHIGIVVNFVVAFICITGVNVEHVNSVYVLVYAVVSAYLLKYVPTDKISDYDDIA